jgi:DNA-binding LytR/AlgR family response regulator
VTLAGDATAGLRVLAVDDEHGPLEDLAHLLRTSARVGLVDTAGSGEAALAALGERPFDAVFLDVRMPGLDGVGLGRVLRRFAAPPALVFVTAYDTAAVAAFELRALDYLLKPVGRARLEEALRRVADAREPGSSGAEAGDDEVLAVDDVRSGATRLLTRSSVLCLQAHGDYVRVHADDGRYLLRARLADLEDRWAARGFVRVHRGFVANMRRAVEVRPQGNGTGVLVLEGGLQVPIARRQVAELRRRLAR